MPEALNLKDVQIYTGYSHFGSCREFAWEAPTTGARGGGPSRFRLRDLRCIDDFEALMIRKDLFLHTPDGKEFVLANFQITDISDPKEIRGVASACRMLMEDFPEIKGIAPREKVVVSKGTHLMAFRAVSALVSSAHARQQIDARVANEVINELVGEIVKAPDAVLNLLAIKSLDDYTFSHNINVATLSMVIGKEMGLAREELHALGTGALLHDLGKLRVPGWILNKEGRLSPSEFSEIARHPRLGIDLLGKSRDLTPQARDVILHHHEKFAGAGYPLGQAGKEIHLLARICAIADAFDALTTPRPYREAFSPYQAMRTLVGLGMTHFDPDILQIFLRKVSLYPPGTLVKLNDGATAVVVRGNPQALLRPVVRLLAPVPGKPDVLDLAKAQSLFIVGPITDTPKEPGTIPES